MNNAIIHPTAIVSAKAKLGEGVKIGPFCIVEDDVEIGDGCELKSNVFIANGSRIGKKCVFFHGAVFGSDPQDLKYDGERTLSIAGEYSVFREYSTVHRGTKETGKTQVGSNCLIMAYCHVAHDCSIGDNVIMSNVVQLAGHVVVEDWASMGGVVKIHQFCRVGAHSFIGADVKVVKDVPPYSLIGRTPPKVEGVNKIGLRRRGFARELIDEIENFYDVVLFSGLNNTEGIKKFLEKGEPPKEVQYCVDFINNSTRGIYR